MKKKGIVMILAAVLAMGALAGCGSTSSSDADTAAATEEKSTTMEERVDDMQSRVDENMAETETTESFIQSLAEEAVSYIKEPGDNDLEPELAAYVGEYLYTLGKEKAPDHVLTTLGKQLYDYVALITEDDGVDSSSEEAEAAYAEIESLIDENLADDEAIESQTATFYELVK